MVKCVLTTIAYTAELMVKTAELCNDDSAKPNLPAPPSPLVSCNEHPDKGTILEFSRYRH